MDFYLTVLRRRHSAFLSLFFLSLFSMNALGADTGVAASGVYAELTLGVQANKSMLSGYYENGTGANPSGGPQFSCIFAVLGKKAGDKYQVQTWFPADRDAKEVILGELRFLHVTAGQAASVQLKLAQLPGGCGNVDPDLASGQGRILSLDSLGTWTEVRVVSAKQAKFHEGPDAASVKKNYVVRGDSLRVFEKKQDWVLADFQGKTKGWIHEADLFPLSPP